MKQEEDPRRRSDMRCQLPIFSEEKGSGNGGTGSSFFYNLRTNIYAVEINERGLEENILMTTCWDKLPANHL